MDLLARRDDGRLDPLAACMLLWSGAVTYNKDREPAIDRSVISLYGKSEAQVSSVTGELTRLIEQLDTDELLRVDHATIGSYLHPVTGADDLTGGVFLLQQRTHPLLIDAAPDGVVRVRYDARLMRGLPHFQDLVLRLVSDLRASCGDLTPYRLLFVETAPHARSPLHDPSPDDIRYDEPFRPELEVTNESTLVPRTALSLDEAATEELACLNAIAALEAVSYTTGRLLTSLRRIERSKAEELKRIEGSMPRKDAAPYANPTKRKGRGVQTAVMRKMVIWSALYVLLGVVVITFGNRLVSDPEAAAAFALEHLQGLPQTFHDIVCLFTGNFSAVGAPHGYALPDVAGAVHTLGMLVVLVGVLFPLTRILRRKRLIDTEVRLGRNHIAFVEHMGAKNLAASEMALTDTIESWQHAVNEAAKSAEAATSDLKLVASTQARLDEALATVRTCAPEELSSLDLAASTTISDYLEQGAQASLAEATVRYQADLAAGVVATSCERATSAQPTLASVRRSTDEVSNASHASDARRHEIIDTHCTHATSIAQRAVRRFADSPTG